MSRSIDLFIETDQEIESLVEKLGELTQQEVRPGQVPGTYLVEVGDVRAELRAHPYVDDGDLSFSRYRFALSCRVPSERRLLDAPETAWLRLVSELAQKAGMATLLVHDLQYRDGAPTAVVGGPSEAEGE